jgi:hypothetical protein
VRKRRERREKLIYEAAEAIRARKHIGERHSCYCCQKRMTDPEFIARGIGPECWQHVLDRVQAYQDARATQGAGSRSAGRTWTIAM